MADGNITVRLLCPVCDKGANASGQPFVSEWAVASHMAGNIQSGDRLHKAWARKYAPEADLTRKGFRLGEELSLVVHEALKIQKAGQAPANIPVTRSLVDQLKEIEPRLHSHIKRRLQEKHGTENDAWWYEGIPETIRVECAKRRELDRGSQEPFKYTYLIDLKTVLEKNWVLFERDFIKIRNMAASKKDFLDQITRLNEVRNRHFHPIRAPAPDSKESIDDLDFVSKIMRAVAVFCDDAT